MYIYIYVRYICDSVYLYDLLLYLSGALPQVWARGQEHISCCTWRINELNCKTMDRQERLRRRREYERV